MDLLPQVSLVLHALSLVAAGIAVQAFRFEGSSSFGLSWLFCLFFALEAFVQSWSLFDPGHAGTGVFFAEVVRPLLQANLQPTDLAKLAWKRVQHDEQAVAMVYRLGLVVFSIFFFVSRVLQLAQFGKPPAAPAPRNRLAAALVLGAMASLLGLWFVSSSDDVVHFVEQQQQQETGAAATGWSAVVRLAQHLSRHTFHALPAALSTLSLLLASLSWNGGEGERVGMQHFLALRWAIAGLGLLQVAPHRLLEPEVVASLGLPFVLTLVFFVATKFVRAHPGVFACLWAVLGAAALLAVRPALFPAPMLDLVQPELYPAFFALSAASVVSCGGLGVTSTLVLAMLVMQLHAKDLLKQG